MPYATHESVDSVEAIATADAIYPAVTPRTPIATAKHDAPCRHGFLAAMREIEHAVPEQLDHGMTRGTYLGAQCLGVAVALLLHALRTDPRKLHPVHVLLVATHDLACALGRCAGRVARELSTAIPNFIEAHHRREHCGPSTHGTDDGDDDDDHTLN